ncbi:NAD(P)H-binding protein [uncultured Flavobacterium sp.]|uniref:NmrA family NAD(P)-binding protein n=1 Tax=uncultured Flavobacterium sp. TaxID=165435 RepID=UPI0025D02692|nr:NAD(P)H-binding protein [uncultured Flavobacterium sp.]
MQNNILVIGGTGKTGRKVVERLEKQNINVCVGSRSAIPSFDWHKPDNWANVMEGIDKMYITFQPDLAVPGALDAIEAITKQAKSSGIKKIVLLSGKGEKEAELCEQVVIHSGIDYTIVRASWFNQNFSESFFLDPILAGHVALPQAEAKVPYVDTDDIADVAVEALLNNEHNGKIYQLTGARTLTFKEVVEEIAIATNRKIAFTPITMQAYVDVMKEQQVPADYIWLIEYLFTEVLADERNSEVTNDIEKVLGRKPKDFSDYVKETTDIGVWEAM